MLLLRSGRNPRRRPPTSPATRTGRPPNTRAIDSIYSDLLKPQSVRALVREGWTPATIALNPSMAMQTLTAASTRIETRTSQDIRRLIQPWQARALTYYDMIGEVNFASQFYSRTLSKVRLFPAILNDNGDAEETTDPLLVELWNRVQDPAGGRAELQGSYGRMRFIIGECYLTCTPDPDWGEVWECLSPDELRVQPGGIYVRYRAPQIGTQEYRNAPDDAQMPEEGLNGASDEIIAYRLWKKHPRYSWWADSSMHASLDVLEELLLLTLAVRAQAKSRAANNGILLWPDEMSFSGLDAEGQEDPLNDPFFEAFIESYLAGIVDPGSAAAGVPLMIRMTSELIPEEKGGPRFLTLNANDSYAEQGMRNELIRRFAMGVDLPPEQLLGFQDSNHWSSWLVDEQTWKTHLMPVTQDMCNDFGSSYLRPAAREAGYGKWDRVVVGYDATEVINHPDQGKDAMDAYANRAISKQALRVAKGFDAEDAMPEDELYEAIGVAIGDSTLAVTGVPQIRGHALETAPGEIEAIDGTKTDTPVSGDAADVEPGPPPAGEPDPRQPVTASADRILGAAEMALERCRELAGARLITRVRNSGVPGSMALIESCPPALIASTLGSEMLVTISAAGADELVREGTRGFIVAMQRLGLNGEAELLAEAIEHHAASTLTDAEPAGLPPRFLEILETCAA